MGTKIRVVTEGKASDFEISASVDFVISEEEVRCDVADDNVCPLRGDADP